SDRQPPVPDDFHEPPALGSFEHVAAALRIDHDGAAHVAGNGVSGGDAPEAQRVQPCGVRAEVLVGAARCAAFESLLAARARAAAYAGTLHRSHQLRFGGRYLDRIEAEA